MYTAKPHMNVNRQMKSFPTKLEAVQYLEKVTGYQMDYEVNKTLKKLFVAEGMSSVEANELAKVYDWELIGKLYEEA